MNQVVVLNADMSILGTTSWKNAVRLIFQEKAIVLAESNRKIHPKMNLPMVIKLIKTIRSLWKTQVPWSKANVHTRDQNTCQYCGEKLDRKKVTIDHVLPQVRGGKNEWPNTVTACFPCNNKKGNKTPSEAKMSLRCGTPRQPTIMEFILKKVQSEGLVELLEDLNIY